VRLKMHIGAVAISLLLGMQIQPAAASAMSAADDYMGHCSDNEQFTPEEVIVACTNFINTATTESWKEEYIPRALYYTGVARRRQGDVKGAEKYFALATARVPGYLAAWRQLVELMTGLSGKDATSKAIELMIARAPHNSHVLNSACWDRAVSGLELDVGLAYCNKALSIDPGSAEILSSRALVEYRLADYASAVKDSTAALAVGSNNAGSFYVRGLAKLKIGQSADGAADVAAAKAAAPGIADTYAKYGVMP